MRARKAHFPDRAEAVKYAQPAPRDVKLQSVAASAFSAVPLEVEGLTEGFHLEPEQSTNALIVHHPQAKYFVV
ncbi:MAG: hypothetical protein JO300_14740 [Silvibacterium sp.]|nr:hypothetical protein [Silvibacterium sp.]MBV8437745.1 hypothetical protein [Silvibacterium sp.]